MISARASDGTSLPFRTLYVDENNNRDYSVTLPKPLLPGSTTLLWLRYKLFLSSIDTGIAHRFFTPKAWGYNGSPRRAVQTVILPRDCEPLLIYPEPKTIFLRQSTWHIVFARRLGEDVMLAPEIFYSSEPEVLSRADEALKFSPALLYGKEQLAIKGVMASCSLDKAASYRFGDIVLSYDKSKTTTTGQLWQHYEKGDVNGRAMEVLRGKKRLVLQVAPKDIPQSLMNFPLETEFYQSLDFILLTRARVALSLGKYRKAQNIISRFLSCEPKAEQRVLAYARMAQALEGQGKTEEATTFLRRAVKGLNALERNSLASVPKELYRGSIVELKERLLKSADDFFAAYGVALSHFESSSFHNASRAIKRALAL